MSGFRRLLVCIALSSALSGSLSFHSSAQGTTLQAWLPLPAADASLETPPA